MNIEARRKKEKKLLKRGQRTFIYCPKCDIELISSDSFVKDTDYVYYKCKTCGTESKWDFDFPCPILVKNETRNDEISRV